MSKIQINETKRYEKLYKYALKLLNKYLFYSSNEDLANDIVQDAYVKCYEYISNKEIQIKDKIKQSGMYSQTHIIKDETNNKLNKHMKNKFENENMKLRYLYKAIFTSVMDYLRDNHYHDKMDEYNDKLDNYECIEANQEEHMNIKDILRKINQMELIYQSVLIRAAKGYTLEEMAEDLCISVNTAKIRLFRARQQLEE